ncbi:MAG: hypothetical protein QUV05_08125 [Phycisphaerae bacterium]|nr:hypothetical protein [Phycisphaerae bacterium]
MNPKIKINLDDPRTAAEFTNLLGFVLGVTDKAPRLSSLDIDPTRAAGFVRRYLAGRGLTVARCHEPATKEFNQVPSAVSAERARALGIIAICNDGGRPDLAAGIIAEGTTPPDAPAMLRAAKYDHAARRSQEKTWAATRNPVTITKLLQNLSVEPEATQKAAWDRSPELQAEFRNRQADYLAYLKSPSHDLAARYAVGRTGEYYEDPF